MKESKDVCLKWGSFLEPTSKKQRLLHLEVLAGISLRGYELCISKEIASYILVEVVK